jgi:hypothetical protein
MYLWKVGNSYTLSFTYLPTYVGKKNLIFFFKIQSICHMEILYCATCHNIYTSKLNNDNGWLKSIFQ